MPLRSLAAVLIVSSLPAWGQARDLPGAAQGFSGQVGGIVRGRTDRGVLFEIRSVQKVWKDNRASDPKSLEGVTVEVRPGVEKGNRNEIHVQFLRLLVVGEDYRLELHHREGNWLEILELTEEQRALARGERREERREENREEGERRDEKRDEKREERAENREERREDEGPAWRGFRGVVRGVVRGRKERGIRLEILEVAEVHGESAAKDPNALVGQTVDVYPRWRKGDDGQWRPVADDVRFLAGLAEGQEVRLAVANDERDAFHLIELPR